MRLRRKWKILISIFLTVVIAGWLAMQVILNQVDAFYANRRNPASLEEARRDGVLLSQPTLKEKMIRWAGKPYSIGDVWIERTMHVEYQFGLFYQRVPTGYKLKVRFENHPSLTSGLQIWEGGGLVCNRSIQFSTSLEDWEHHATTYFTDILEPLPTMLECVVKQYSE